VPRRAGGNHRPATRLQWQRANIHGRVSSPCCGAPVNAYTGWLY